MTDDRKAAEAAVKTAEKAHDAAAKKADAAREKYIELNVVRNTAARTLAHARTHPALFDDDPLLVVSPGNWPVREAPSGLVVRDNHFRAPDASLVQAPSGAITAGIAVAGLDVRLDEARRPAAEVAHEIMEAQRAAAPATATPAAPPAQVPDPDEIAPVADLTGAEELPPEEDAPPWEKPAATPAPKTRRVGQRRTAAAKEAQEHPQAPALADPNPPEVASPPAAGGQQFTPEGFPVEPDVYSPF